MKTIKGLVIGCIIGGAIGFALGYNHGRGAPLLTNPFEEYTLADDMQRTVDEMGEKLKRGTDKAAQSVKESLE